MHQRMAPVVVGLEDRDVHVAVSDMTAAGDECSVVLGEHCDLGQVVGDGRPWDHGVDEIVAPGRLTDEERSLTASMSWAPDVAGST